MQKINKKRISMKVLFILYAVFAYAGTREISQPLQIIGGRDALLHAWKWQVSLRTSGTHFCGGSLIHGDWILTAAHCVYHSKTKMKHPGEIAVHLGAHDFINNVTGEVTMGLSEIFHPPTYTYNPTGPFHSDIALLKLASSVKPTPYISTIRIAHKGDELQNGDEVVITGWGAIEKFQQPKGDYLHVCNKTYANDFEETDTIFAECGYITLHEEGEESEIRVFPKVLQQTTVQVQTLCSASEKVICVGDDNINRGACVGDSGGPMVKSVNGTWIQFGVMSYLDDVYCRHGYGSSKYTKVNEYLKWIQSITKLP